jgi:hypothetical protein
MAMIDCAKTVDFRVTALLFFLKAAVIYTCPELTLIYNERM